MKRIKRMPVGRQGFTQIISVLIFQIKTGQAVFHSLNFLKWFLISSRLLSSQSPGFCRGLFPCKKDDAIPVLL